MGERELIGAAGIGILFVLIALRMPIGLAMIAVGVGGNYALSQVVSFLRFDAYLRQFKSLLWESVANYDLSVIPLFVLMGALAGRAGLSADLFKGIEALTTRIRGGVAMAAVGACAGFGAVCGSSVATAATMGRVALPEMDRLGYHPRLSTGALAAGGTMGILIPPSVALVLYSVVVEASILDMFQAALVPGLMALLFFIVVIALIGWLVPGMTPAPTPQDPAERRLALKRFLPVMAIFCGIIFGLGVGLFTPTPAASIGVAVIIIYALIVPNRDGKRLGLVGIRASVLETAAISGMIYFILFGAEVLKTFFTRSNLPSMLSTWASTAEIDPTMMLLLMLLILVVLGCFMESLSMILIVVPFFWPIVTAMNGGMYVGPEEAVFGLDETELKIWFGIIALVVVELGMITPPVGLNVFVISTIARQVPMLEVFKGVAPFFAIELVRVGILLMLPGIVLLLPRLL